MEVVQYHKEMEHEEPFMLGGIKWIYCWGKYPDGKIDVAVYRFSHDLAYNYTDFKKAMGINESTQKNINKKINENMEDNIKDKILKLKATQEELNARLTEFKESISELEAIKDQLVPEVLAAFKGQTEGAEKLKVDVDGLLVEVIQAHEKKTVSYKVMSEIVIEELAKLDVVLGKTAEQLQEDSKVAQKVKGQLKIGGLKVYEGESDELTPKIVGWLNKSAEFKNKNIEAAEMSVDTIEQMIQKHDQEQSDKYATSTMDDVESGAIKENVNTIKITESQLKSIVKKMLKEMDEGNNTTAFTSMRKHVDETDLMGDDNHMDDTEFVAHGTYTVSNSGGYEVMLSDSGDMAKVRDAFGSDDPKTSDWLEVEYVDDEETGEPVAVIDPNGYNIPLNMVMKVNEGESWMETRAGAEGQVFEGVSVTNTNKKDDFNRPIYKDKKGGIYVDVSLGKDKNPDLHSVTKSGEPDTPLKDFEIEKNELNEVVNRYKQIINY